MDESHFGHGPFFLCAPLALQGAHHDAKAQKNTVFGIYREIGLLPGVGVILQHPLGRENIGSAPEQLSVLLKGTQHDVQYGENDQEGEKRQFSQFARD